MASTAMAYRDKIESFCTFTPPNTFGSCVWLIFGYAQGEVKRILANAWHLRRNFAAIKSSNASGCAIVAAGETSRLFHGRRWPFRLFVTDWVILTRTNSPILPFGSVM